ncbi:hypothetical protein LTR86_009178 [Recurvomyces mirabilis]|nr:hypothetical protein LTR86_009178 [Recurvomyces mirabilis]
MPPKARKVKAAAAAKIKRQAEDEAASLTHNNVDAVKLIPWKTGSKLATSGKLGEVHAQWNVSANASTQTIEVQHNEPFELKPLTVFEGRYKGQRVLVLSPAENSHYFPFLDLPPELRKMIFDLLLGGESTISVETYKPPHKPRRPVTQGFMNAKHRRDKLKWDSTEGKWIGQKPSDLSILRTNKQMRDEAGAAIYGRHFDLIDSTGAAIFVDAIGNFRSYLKHISITFGSRMYGTRVRAMFKHLVSSENLKSITIPHDIICSQHQEIRPRSYDTSQGFARACAPYIKKIHKVRTASGAVVQALDLIQLTSVAKCRQCEHDNVDGCQGLFRTRDRTWKATMKCNEGEAHDEDVRAKFRAALARLAGIVDA